VDIKEYIESGILEAYVLGALPADEQAKVADDIARNPQLANELLAIENTMRQFAATLATEPPAGLEDKIWNSIQSEKNIVNAGDETQKAPRVIPFQPGYRKPFEWRYAALWLALIGSLVVNLLLMYQGKLQQADKAVLADKIDKLQAGQQRLTQMVNNYAMTRTMMADTGMQTIVMHTVVKGHPMAATLYWGKNKGEAYVSMDALPMPPKGKQYQLWVIQGGKPVDMGVLPNDMVNSPVMQKINMQVTSGEAFAISLEKQGGNSAPTEVYVMGKV
jgi:anti-sigma-K factor RskA